MINELNAIERQIINCPCITQEDIDTYYPEPSPEAVFLMSLSYEEGIPEEVDIHLYIKTNLKGERYIEIVAYNECLYKEKGYKRFIIQRGYAMPIEDEEELLTLITKYHGLSIDMGEFAAFQEEVADYLDDIRMKVFQPNEIGEYLDFIYFASHRSGAKETLYKSGYYRLAFNITDFDGYNMVGNTPSDIFGGVSNKLIRILYDLNMENCLCDEDEREYVKELYRRYSSYFGKGKLPNRYQWRYIEEYGLGEKVSFDKNIYERLSECHCDSAYSLVKRYIELSSLLKKVISYKKMPAINKLQSAVSKMEMILKQLNSMDETNRKLKVNNPTGRYVFYDDEFIIVTPTTVKEFIEEAVEQDNCLLTYIDAVANGETNIVFMRKRKSIGTPFVTIEIHDSRVTQVRGKFNMLPSKKEFEFVEKFASANGLKYNPSSIIYDEDYDDYDDYDDGPEMDDEPDQELCIYLADYLKRNPME